jgi:hypothetical protein
MIVVHYWLDLATANAKHSQPAIRMPRLELLAGNRRLGRRSRNAGKRLAR